MSKRNWTILGLLLIGTTPAQAASLCNCCGEKTVASCVAACETVSVEADQCVPTVDFAAKADIGPGKNALYEFPLSNLKIYKTDETSLELYRRLLEKLRMGAEADREAALWERHDGKIDEATAASRVKRYEDAIVNYYLGAQAYRLAKRQNR